MSGPTPSSVPKYWVETEKSDTLKAPSTTRTLGRGGDKNLGTPVPCAYKKEKLRGRTKDCSSLVNYLCIDNDYLGFRNLGTDRSG